jgi:flagellar biosynthesis/type III secretory pathway M-ring protein FliF/YscJ
MLDRLADAAALREEADRLEPDAGDEGDDATASRHRSLPAPTHEQRLLTTRNMAQQDPKAVASVLKGWVNGHG